ncbi:hypothetical protein HPB51_029487 [Rhipicephalus microplus]|uniref:Tick transposon n=1 Tax=Rhipicephalus microplus TaxID=6941 RepID=A0A9J6CUH9_RHIMP|nr:hypothetical protein HPB51_029487 [Rhipicephalus microplus]
MEWSSKLIAAFSQIPGALSAPETFTEDGAQYSHSLEAAMVCIKKHLYPLEFNYELPSGNFVRPVATTESFRRNPKASQDARFSPLQGAAAAAISGLQVTAECYGDAIEILISSFGDNRRIVQDHLRQLRTLPEVDSLEDVYNLRKLLNYVQCRIRGLKGLNISPASYATMMTDILLEALPTDIVVGYYRKEANLSSPPSMTDNAGLGQQHDSTSTATAEKELQELLKYLRVEVESREKSEARESKGKKGTRPPEDKRNFASLPTAAVLQCSSKAKDKDCLFCWSTKHASPVCDSSITHEEKLKKLAAEK